MADKKQSVAERLASEAKDRLAVVTKEIKNVESDVLGPLNNEKEQLEAMLSPKTETSAPEATPEPSPARSPQRKLRTRRSRSGGTHAEKAVKFFADNPGASASDYAKAAKIAPNYLYRVLKDLVEEGQLMKEGRSYSVA